MNQSLNFQGIEVHNNPWQCDCQLQEFTRWVHLTAVPRVAEPRCQQPLRLQVQQPCVKVMGMMGMMGMMMMIMMMVIMTMMMMMVIMAKIIMMMIMMIIMKIMM